jgi:hypothetical protein
MDLTEFLSLLKGVKPNGKGHIAQCPAHDDSHASLSVNTADDGRILVNCFVGCEPASIARGIGRQLRDLFPNEPTQRNGHAPKTSRRDFTAQAKTYADALTPGLRAELANHLGLPECVLAKLQIGWNESEECWTFPEHDGQARIIGINRRWRDCKKKAMNGGNRGLTLPVGWDAGDGPIFSPEGASNTLAFAALGLSAVGRPNNKAGADLLIDLLSRQPKRPIVVVGDVDTKDDGKWPGKEGAVEVSRKIAVGLPGWDISWALPPNQTKDVRLWANNQKLDTTLADAWDDAGHRLLNEIKLNVLTKDNPATADLTDPIPILISLDTVEKKEVDWIWPGRIPRGAISIIDGDPDLGKSFTILDVAARWTTGRPMPNEAGADRPPGNVLILNCEDDLSRTTRPRLDILDGDPAKVFSWEAVIDSHGKRSPVFPYDLELLKKIIVEREISLVTIDSFMGYIDEQTDSHKDSDIRRLMYGLRSIAEETQAAIVLIRHLNKLINVSEALYRGGGSIGIIGAARSGLLIARDPDNESRRILARVKGNLCAPPPALAYELVVENGMARVEWLGPVELDAVSLLSSRKKEKTTDAAKNKAAGTKLLTALDELDPDRKGETKSKLRSRARLSSRDYDNAAFELERDGVIESVQVSYKCGKGREAKTDGIRRKVRVEDGIG